MKKPCQGNRSNMDFFDSHCHFDFAVFDQDRESIWRECDTLGIKQLIIPGVSAEQWSTAKHIAQAYNTIYYGVGLHPWWIKSADVSKAYLTNLRQQLEANVDHEQCVALGECGLDATIETPLRLQQNVLDTHLQLAQDIA
ncbi:MAG: TatD family deoxyribonuclease, partial [Moraxellaceae bacterium]